jgi:hypothetical protein
MVWVLHIAAGVCASARLGKLRHGRWRYIRLGPLGADSGHGGAIEADHCNRLRIR